MYKIKEEMNFNLHIQKKLFLEHNEMSFADVKRILFDWFPTTISVLS